MADTSLHDKILQLSSAFWTSRTLHAVAELGVADALGDEPQSAEELARKLNLNADALNRALRLLASFGIFEQRDGRWAHTPESRLLRNDEPRSVRGFLRLLGLPFIWQSWGHIEHSLRTGEPAVNTLGASGPFDYLNKHPEERTIFHAGMTAKAHREIPPVLEAYDFSQHKRIADVGGGRGHLLRSILDKSPGSAGILFDQDHVVADAPEHPRMERRGGDFFAGPLPEADAYLLMDVLHDWPDADVVRILKSIRKSAPAGATVLAIETVLPQTPGPHLAKALDVNMLVMTGGRERTPDEHGKLLADAGFRLEKVIPTAAPYSLVKAVISG
jgi:hypothetical protein